LELTETLLRMLTGTPHTGYNVTMIVITACVIVLYFALIEAKALWEKRKAEKEVQLRV
jgi:hypothetical protein